MSDHDKLKEIFCPKCDKKTLYLGEKMVVRPLGTWSLAGVQDKRSAVLMSAILCESCDFYKLPSN